MTRSGRNGTHSWLSTVIRSSLVPSGCWLVRTFVRGDAAKAIATAREIMRDDPTRGTFELAEVLVALDRIEEAHQELERLRSTKASPEEIDRRLALLAYNAGDMKEAQQRFTEMATHGEATDAALLYLADIAARDGIPTRRLQDIVGSRIRRSRSRRVRRLRRFCWHAASASEAMLLMDDYVTDHPDTEFEARLSEARLLADHGDAETGLKMLSDCAGEASEASCDRV